MSNEFSLNIPVDLSTDDALKALSDLNSRIVNDLGGAFSETDSATEKTSSSIASFASSAGQAVKRLTDVVRGLVDDLFSVASTGESTGQISGAWQQLAKDAMGIAGEMYGAGDAVAAFKSQGGGLADMFGDITNQQKMLVDLLGQAVKSQGAVTTATKEQAQAQEKVAYQSRFTRDHAAATKEETAVQNKSYLDLVFTLIKVRALWGLTKDAIKWANAPLEQSKALMGSIQQTGQALGQAVSKPVSALGKGMAEGLEPVKQQFSQISQVAKDVAGKVVESGKQMADQYRDQIQRGAQQASDAIKKVGDAAKQVGEKAKSGTALGEIAEKGKRFLNDVAEGAQNAQKGLAGSLLALFKNKSAVAGLSASFAGLLIAGRVLVVIVKWIYAFRTALIASVAAITGVYLAIRAVEGVLVGTFDAIKKINRATIFGARDQKNIDAMRNALSGMITQMEAISEIQKFKQLGFSDQTAVQAAGVAETMHRLTGQTREATLEMLRSGQVSDQMLASVGASQGELLSTIETVQAKLGRTVNPAERATIAIQLLAKKTKDIGELAKTAFPDDPFAKFSVTARTTLEDLTRLWNEDFGPFMISIANGVLWVFDKVIAGLRYMVAAGRWLMRNVLGATGKVAIEAGDAAEKLKTKIGGLQQQSAKAATGAAMMAKAAQEWRAKWDEAGKATKIAFDTVAASITNVGEASSLVSAQSASLKQLADLQVRYAKAVNFVAIAGFERASEEIRQSKMSARTKYEQIKAALLVDEAIRKETKAAKELASRNFELLSVEQMRYQQSARSFALTEQEIQANQKLRGIQDQASELEARRKAMQIKMVDLALTIQLSRTTLKQKHDAYAQLVLLRRQTEEVGKAEAAVKERLRIETQNVFIAGQLAKYQSDLEKSLEHMGQRNAVADLRRESEKMAFSVREATGQLTVQEQAQFDSLQQVRNLADQQVALARKLAETRVNIQALIRQASVLPEGERRNEMQIRIGLLNEEAGLLEKQIGLQKDLADAAKNSADIGTSTILELQKLAQNFNKRTAQLLTSGLQSTVTSLFSGISEGIAGAIQGTKDLGGAILGSILSALGELAIQFGSFYAAVGLGQLAIPGGQGSGIALLAAAAGLYGLAGILKGAGAAVSKPAQSTAPSSGGATQTTPTKTDLPGRDRSKEQQPIQIFVSVDQEPWGKPTPQERYKGFTRWAEQMQRSTGFRGSRA